MDGLTFLATLNTQTSRSHQQIHFTSVSPDNVHITGDSVTIVPDAEPHDLGSSKLRIKNLVNFGWQIKQHPGQLVALHKSGDFLAYGLSNIGKATGMVRVTNRKTGDRALIKTLNGLVSDLAFSHGLRNVILGVLDEFANVYVFHIHPDKLSEGIIDNVLQIKSSSQEAYENTHLRIIWSPCVPDEYNDNDGDSAHVLAVIKNTVVEILNIEMIKQEYGMGVHEESSISKGRLLINDHRGTITDSALSPDGTAIATASVDGQVKFFQAYMHESQEPRCLHQWTPHDGKPISSLFFLDDYLNNVHEDHFWKYALTGANCNTEFKIWNCELWTCLQTINFMLPPSSIIEFKVTIDLTASYLLISDNYKKYIYVLRLKQMADSMSFVSVSQFATPSAILSMTILEAGVKQHSAKDKTETSDSEDEEEDEEEDEKELDDKDGRPRTIIRFLLVQPKSLQECCIVYDDVADHATANLAAGPTVPPPRTPEMESKKSSDAIKVRPTDSCELKEAADKITLMSPELFETKSIVSDNKEGQEPKRGATITLATNTRQLLAEASGASSPSREVQDILCSGNGDDDIDLNAEYVVTGDDEDDFDEDSDDDDDDDAGNVYDVIAIKKESEDSSFENITVGASHSIKVKKDIIEVGRDLSNAEGVDPLAPSVKNEVLQSPILLPMSSIQGLGAPGPVMILKQEPMLSSSQAKLNVSAPPLLAGKDLELMFGNTESAQQILLKKLNDMTSLIQTQRAELQVLREEVRALHSNDLKHVEEVVQNTWHLQCAQLSEVTQRDTSALINAFSQVIEKEMSMLLPQMTNLVSQNVHQILTKEMKHNLMELNGTLRDDVTNVLRSRATLEYLGQSLAVSMQTSLQSSLKEVLSSVLLPGFERSMQSMLSSLAAIFNKGCKEYETHLRQFMSKQLEPLIKELKEKVSSIPDVKHSATLPGNSMEQMEQRLMAQIKDIVSHEVRQGFMAYNAILNRSSPATPTFPNINSPIITGSASAAVTPSKPTIQEIQNQINCFIKLEEWDKAFQAALFAHNLNVVVATCESVNSSYLFGLNPCPLSQQSLLSLIQQLGNHLDDKTELKHKYLEEAVMNLDTQNPVIRKHMTVVLPPLQKNLLNFIEKSPDKAITRSIKRLLMVTESLLPASK